MAIAVEADVAANPVDIRLFGADAVVLEAYAGAHELEQAWRGRSIGAWRMGRSIGAHIADSEPFFPLRPSAV